MDHIRVKSSNIESVAHNGEHMQITFKGGHTYHYANVPAHVFDACLLADSVGKFIADQIKGKFTHSKVKK